MKKGIFFLLFFLTFQLLSAQNLVRFMENGRYGYKNNETGMVVIQPQWPQAFNFTYGVAVVGDENGNYGCIDRTGKIVVPLKWQSIKPSVSNGNVIVSVEGEHGQRKTIVMAPSQLISQQSASFPDKNGIKAEMTFLKENYPDAIIKKIKGKDGSLYIGSFNKKTKQKEGVGTLFYPTGGFYRGEWSNDNYNGEGLRMSSAGDYYSGSWLSGQKNGQGEMNYPNGNYQIGKWENDSFVSGRVKTSEKGNEYEGAWSDGTRNGEGTMKFKSGSIYIGTWQNGKMNGQGKITYKNGNQYYGEWKEGKKTKGTMRYRNGDRYSGDWVDGKWCGKGTMFYANGDKYSGDWTDGKLYGKGTMFYANGDRYEGEWKEGSRNGQGRMVYKNGDVYDGEWKDGKKDGSGVMDFKNGDTCIGLWSMDSFTSGQAKIKKKDGIYEGEFDGGQIMEGTITFADGGIFTGTISNDSPVDGKYTFKTIGFSFDGELKNGIPYGKYDGTVPTKGSWGHFYSFGDWQSIKNAKDGVCSEINGDAISGLFIKKSQGKYIPKEKKYVSSFTYHMVGGYTEYFDLEVTGQMVNGVFEGKSVALLLINHDSSQWGTVGVELYWKDGIIQKGSGFCTIDPNGVNISIKRDSGNRYKLTITKIGSAIIEYTDLESFLKHIAYEVDEQIDEVVNAKQYKEIRETDNAIKDAMIDAATDRFMNDLKELDRRGYYLY